MCSENPGKLIQQKHGLLLRRFKIMFTSALRAQQCTLVRKLQSLTLAITASGMPFCKRNSSISLHLAGHAPQEIAKERWRLSSPEKRFEGSRARIIAL